MKNQFRLLALLGTFALPTIAAPDSDLCKLGECQPAITQTRYFDRAAFKITDGKTEAIVVPGIGRIMSYGRVGQKNVLWNSPTSKGYNWGWLNYGGDKNWLAPQSYWDVFHSKGNWPPDTAFDGKPHQIDVLSGGKLRMTSPLSSTGIRFIRTIFFDTNGELVIQQTARKERGAPIRASIWNIAQVVPCDAVFVPLNPNSPYKNSFLLLEGERDKQPMETIRPTLLRVEPTNRGGGWKIGTDSPVSSIASVKDGVAFLLKTPLPKGQYPDGAFGAGFPVELYINSNEKDPAAHYVELELLGPLQNYTVGTAYTHTMRWSLHDMPSKNAKSSEVADSVEKLLTEK